MSSKKAEPAKSFSPDQARKEYFPSIGRGAFYSYIKQGLIPSIRFGRKIVITRSAMEKLMESGIKARSAA